MPGPWSCWRRQDGELGASAAEVDRRTGGAVTRAVQMAGEAFKRGQALELLYPAGLDLDRVVVLALGKPGEASPLDLEALGGSLVVKLKALRVSEAQVAVDAIAGPRGRRRPSSRPISRPAPACAAIGSTSTRPRRRRTTSRRARSRG